MLLLGVHIFLLSLLFAFFEIEVEGKFGWAERLPTWYRKGGLSRLFSLLSGGKPLTGYHLFMNLFMLAAFHLPFAAGLPWSPEWELLLVASLILFLILEDLLWFLFNPAYGVRSFRKGRIWWNAAEPWFLGLFPASYLSGLVLSLLLGWIASRFAGDGAIFIGWLGALGSAILLSLLSALLAPSYARWHRKMRQKDDRGEAAIFH